MIRWPRSPAVRQQLIVAVTQHRLTEADALSFSASDIRIETEEPTSWTRTVSSAALSRSRRSACFPAPLS
jgi:hypothetical protein